MLLCLVFFECFSCVVGMVFMSYLLVWCMVLVCCLLCDECLGVVCVVEWVGYSLVSIFSVVFICYVGVLLVCYVCGV